MRKRSTGERITPRDAVPSSRRGRPLAAILALVTATTLTAPLPDAAAATPVTRHLGVPFAARQTGALRLDRYAPAHAAGRPVVILVHGGGWWSGARGDLESSARDLVAAGYVAVSIDYRLACGTAAAPRWAWGSSFNHPGPLCGAYLPQQVVDVQQAVAFVRRHARAWGGDPHRIALAGSSAGGHLALLAAATAPPAARVRAVVSWSGPPSDWFVEAQDPHQSGTIKAAFTNAVGCVRDNCPDLWDAASPELVITEATAPFAVFASVSRRERQVPVAALTRFHRHVTALGWRNVAVVARGACHSRECLATPIVSGGGGTVWSRTVAFLRTDLGR